MKGTEFDRDGSPFSMTPQSDVGNSSRTPLSSFHSFPAQHPNKHQFVLTLEYTRPSIRGDGASHSNNQGHFWS